MCALQPCPCWGSERLSSAPLQQLRFACKSNPVGMLPSVGRRGWQFGSSAGVHTLCSRNFQKHPEVLYKHRQSAERGRLGGGVSADTAPACARGEEPVPYGSERAVW